MTKLKFKHKKCCNELLTKFCLHFCYIIVIHFRYSPPPDLDEEDIEFSQASIH